VSRATSTAPVDRAAEDPDGSGSVEPRSLSSLVGRSTMWAVLANVTMRFASIAVTALLARLLSPEDFGVFAVALAVYLVVSSLAELGMGSAIARAATEPDDIAPTVTSLSVLVSLVVAGGLAATAPVLATALGQPDAAAPIRVLALCLALTGVFAVPGAQLVREFRQDRIFLGIIVGFVVANPLLVVLAVEGGGATAFAWSRVAGQVATGLVYVLSVSRRYRPGWHRASVRPLLAFGLPLAFANLVSWTLLNADYLLLGRLVGAAQVGVYMIAFNVANWSTAVLGSVLNSVVVPALGRVREDRARLGSAVLAASELVALLALPIGAMSLALAQPLVAVLFGPTWAEAVPVLRVLSVFGVLYAFSLLCANVLVATGRTVRLLLVQAGWVAVLVPAIVVGLRLGGLPGVAWAHVVTLLAVALPGYLVTVLRSTGTTARALLRTGLRPTVAATAAAGLAWLLAGLFTAPWLALLAGGSLGGLVYAALVAPLALRHLPDRLTPAWLPGPFRPRAVAATPRAAAVELP
jgi:lipopolysaccharide exporter